MAPYLDAYRYNGRLYGVPTLRGYVTNQYIIMRKDILEELNLVEKAENLDSWSGFEEIMQAVTDAYKGTGLFAVGNATANSYGIPSGGGFIAYDKFADTYIYDGCGNAYAKSDNEGHLSWVMEDPQVEKNYQRAKTWLDNGWGRPDTALDQTHGDELMKQNIQFSTIQASEYGVEAVKSANCGYPLVAAMHAPGMIMTSTLTSWGIGVASTADEPEGACKMINILYTDEYVMNLITRGQEDVDYRLVDGECVYDLKETGSYYYEADFLIGNNLLTHPVEGQGADYFKEIKAINDAADISPYLGFVFDNGELSQYIANITAVGDQYSADMGGGNYTPEMYAEEKAKYEAAGVHEYLDELQKQLDAWMAAN
jgi:putative aldouronate transport system substrate-binding protein